MGVICCGALRRDWHVATVFRGAEFGGNQTEADIEGREANYGQAKAADPGARCSP
jgi:hypothetical protein